MTSHLPGHLVASEPLNLGHDDVIQYGEKRLEGRHSDSANSAPTNQRFLEKGCSFVYKMHVHYVMMSKKEMVAISQAGAALSKLSHANGWRRKFMTSSLIHVYDSCSTFWPHRSSNHARSVTNIVKTTKIYVKDTISVMLIPVFCIPLSVLYLRHTHSTGAY